MCIGLFCITAFVTGKEKSISLPIISGIVMDDPYPAKMMSVPIANAHVELRTIYTIHAGNLTTIYSVYGTLIDSTTTDSNGKFSFNQNTSLQSDYSSRYDLIVVTHSDYRTRQITLTAARDTTLNVLLLKSNAASSVSGTINASCSDSPNLCNPKPVPGCSVSVCLSSYSLTVNEPAKHVIYSTETDSQGNYSIKYIPLSFNGEQVDVTANKSGITKLSSVIIKNTETTIANFNDYPINRKSDTSFQVYPSKPTSNDSVLFIFFNSTDSCCSTYRDMSISTVDSNIYIGYNLDNSQCTAINCNGTGKWSFIKSKPLNPGNYNVYKYYTRDFCNPGVPCLPMPTLAPIAKLIGTLVVDKPIGVINTDKKINFNSEFTITFTESSVTVNLTKSSQVTLKAYSVNGVLLGKLYNGSLPTGSHSISLNNFNRVAPANSMIILSMTVDGVTKSMMRVIGGKYLK